MFYNHWKKIALTLTAFFWASCSETTEDTPLYGCPPDGCYDEPESSNSNNEESSSSETNGTENGDSSSSEFFNPPVYGDEPVFGESSSSSELSEESSSSEEATDRYKLASDTSITCKYTDERVFPGNCLLYDNYSKKGAANDDEFAPLYGVPLYGTPSCVRPEINLKYDCSDGKTRIVHDPVENPLVNKEDGKLLQEGQMLYTWDEYAAKFRNSSSSSVAASSSSGEDTCVPGDSVIAYYPPSYSADVAKMDAEEKAKYESSRKIDSIVNTLNSVPQCIADLQQELDSFVALYGAPIQIHTNEVCSDGITRPTQEYLDYLTMKEEWEKNKPALDKECQKIYEDKLKDIEDQINQCLATSNPNTNLTVCDLEAMCPVYGVTSTCTNMYRCKDGVTCTRNDGETDIKCIDKQGESVTYTRNEFNKKYHSKERY